MLFKGPADKVELSTDPTFAAVLLSFEKFAKEGNTWPAPAPVKDVLHNNKDGVTGWEVPFAIRALDVDVADADTIAAAGENLTEYYVRFTKGDVVLTVIKATVCAYPSPFQEFGKYGYVVIEGKSTGTTRADAYTLVTAPAGP